MPFLAKVIFAPSSGMAEDEVVNTFVFDADAQDEVATEAARQNVRDFYNGSYGTAPFTKVANCIGNSISRATNATQVKFYDLEGKLGGDEAIGSPVATGAFTLDAAGGSDPLPAEVALCLSFHSSLAGVAESTPAGLVGPVGDFHPRARRRGRVYIGPLWSDVCVSDGTTGNAVPASGARSVLARAAFALIDTSGPGGSGNWCVWSRRNANLTVVEGGWVDNAFDTQRRRGRDATARTLVSATA